MAAGCVDRGLSPCGCAPAGGIGTAADAASILMNLFSTSSAPQNRAPLQILRAGEQRRCDSSTAGQRWVKAAAHTSKRCHLQDVAHTAGGCRQGSAPPAKQASAAGRASSAGTALSSRLTCPCPRPRPAPAPAGRLRTRADVTGAAAGQHRADSSRSVQAAAAHISAAGLCSDVKTGPGEPHTSN